MLSITLPAISDVTLPAGTTIYVPLNGSDPGNTINYAVTATDYSKVTPVVMPATNKSVVFNIDGFSQPMEFQLLDNLAPATATAIENLVASGFYDGLQIYRNGMDQDGNPFVIQGGNNPPTGAIKSPQPANMAEEFNPDLEFTAPGMLAMARTSSPSTSSTEFFVTEQAARFLDFSYTIFGVQTAGTSVNQAIAAMPDEDSTQDPNGVGYLQTPVTITSASIVTDTQNGVLQLSAPAGVSGTVTITVIASDGTGSATPQTFVVTIQPDDASNPANPFAAVVPSATAKPVFVPSDGGTGLTTNENHSLQFTVSGVSNGNLVEILADGNVIGEATASGTSVTVTTDASKTLTDGGHTFTAIQIAKNQTVTVDENSSDPSGYTPLSKTADVPSFSSSAVQVTVDAAPTATAVLDNVKRSDSPASITFVVTYSNPGDQIAVSSLDGNDILVTNANNFRANARFLDDTVSTDGSTVTATYAFDSPDGTWDPAALVRYTLTMQPNQVSDSHGNYVAEGVLLTFNPSDLTDLTVTVNQPSNEIDPTSASTIDFTAIFNKAVSDFTTGDVTISGTAGATTATVTASDSTGQNYTIAVSGMTRNGTVIVSLASNVAHDAVGNPNNPSTSTDNTVTYNGIPFSVTINQASTQADPTTGSTIHFTVVFATAVVDFSGLDVAFGGTVLGNLVASVTASDTSGTTYDVAVGGMASTGKLIVSIPAGKVHDALGALNSASTGTDNSVQFNLVNKPSFRLLAPTSGTDNVGQTVVIAWTDANIIAGTRISLCYDTINYANDKAVSGKQHWIEVDQVIAANGVQTYQWGTSGMAPGTYYIGGYLFSGGTPIRSAIATPITIVVPTPVFRLTTPTSGTYNVGQTVTVAWAASNMASNATVSLCYDSDKIINGNEKYFEVDKVAANDLYTAGYGDYPWDTTGMKPGTYYIGGYLWSNGKATWSHLTQSITLVDPVPTFRVTAPTSGSFTPGQTVDIYFMAHNFAANSTVSLFYDKDTAVNGNEKYIEVNGKTLTASDDNQYRYYQWTVPDLAAGQYYIGGYIWSNGKATFSHLTQPITITAPALMVDASAAPSAAAAPLSRRTTPADHRRGRAAAYGRHRHPGRRRHDGRVGPDRRSAQEHAGRGRGLIHLH